MKLRVPIYTYEKRFTLFTCMHLVWFYEAVYKSLKEHFYVFRSWWCSCVSRASGRAYINKVVLTISTYFSTVSPLRNSLIPTIFTRYSSHLHRVIFYTQPFAQTYSTYSHRIYISSFFCWGEIGHSRLGARWWVVSPVHDRWPWRVVKCKWLRTWTSSWYVIWDTVTCPLRSFGAPGWMVDDKVLALGFHVLSWDLKTL